METKRHTEETKAEKTPQEKEREIDRQMKDSFPASDPPSYAGGNHIIGAPKNRESETPDASSAAVQDAKKALRDKKPAKKD